MLLGGMLAFMTDVTQILSQIESGDPAASEQLLPLVYDELRKLAAAKLAHEKPGQTLQATALVHEAYLRLVDVEEVQQWNSRGHFFGAAAEAMRRILVENARRKKTLRRGGQAMKCELSELDGVLQAPNDSLLDLDDALSKLAGVDARSAEIVKLRVFVGMTVEETAHSLGISVRIAKRDWAFARAWLLRKMGEDSANAR